MIFLTKKKNQVPFLLMVVDILVQIYAQNILNERLEALKLKKFPNLHQSKNIALLDFDFASFHQPLINDDVIGFVGMLEHMSTNKQLSLSNIFSQKSPSRGISCYMRQQVLEVLRSQNSSLIISPSFLPRKTS